jgi:hypothetical protein
VTRISILADDELGHATDLPSWDWKRGLRGRGSNAEALTRTGADPMGMSCFVTLQTDDVSRMAMCLYGGEGYPVVICQAA